MWMVGTSAEDHRNPKEVESNMSHPVLGEVLEEMGPAVTLRGQQGPETRGPGGEQAGPWRAEAGGWKGLRPRDRAELARRWWRAVEQVCALRGMHCEQVMLWWGCTLSTSPPAACRMTGDERSEQAENESWNFAAVRGQGAGSRLGLWYSRWSELSFSGRNVDTFPRSSQSVRSLIDSAIRTHPHGYLDPSRHSVLPELFQGPPHFFPWFCPHLSLSSWKSDPVQTHVTLGHPSAQSLQWFLCPNSKRYKSFQLPDGLRNKPPLPSWTSSPPVLPGLSPLQPHWPLNTLSTCLPQGFYVAVHSSCILFPRYPHSELSLWFKPLLRCYCPVKPTCLTLMALNIADFPAPLPQIPLVLLYFFPVELILL